jgi:hypothetical protein
LYLKEASFHSYTERKNTKREGREVATLAVYAETEIKKGTMSLFYL